MFQNAFNWPSERVCFSSFLEASAKTASKPVVTIFDDDDITQVTIKVNTATFGLEVSLEILRGFYNPLCPCLTANFSLDIQPFPLPSGSWEVFYVSASSRVICWPERSCYLKNYGSKFWDPRRI